MTTFPNLTTERLLLRQFQLSDAPVVQRLAGRKEVAAGTLLPHPYPDGQAEQWIMSQRDEFEAGTLVSFAIALLEHDTVIGSIGLAIVAEHEHARMSYWLGIPYWNQGYATEAVQSMLTYGFTQRQLHRIYAPHFSNNPASRRVLQKVGMRYEGRMREHYRRFGDYVDVEIYGMLEQDFRQR